ncbi:hypothetical protein [Treponema sp.]|uniref:hypothetical protein n=1 Tax=Treponema sp. TaxID=166 RepID=UPI00388EE73A
MDNVLSFKKSTESKIKAYNEWERRVGKTARNKEICEASVILSALKNENDEVIYTVMTMQGLIAITENTLLEKYEIID